MRVAVVGCCHGELDRMYETVMRTEEELGAKVDLLIVCGDLQAIRDHDDLRWVTCPPEFKAMGDFHKYYKGLKTAPVTTIFIGGNHEAPNFLRELQYGGWVAPRIYYLGYAGVIRVGSLRIGGVSGIFKNHNYFKGHFESPPYSDDTRRSAYHAREWDIVQLAQITGPIDIMVSHDWPRGIWKYGNMEQLMQWADHNMRREMETNQLGNPGSMELLQKLRPAFWFSSHLHVKFPALVPHEDGTYTRFLALDKCAAARDFIQILEIDPTSASFLRRLEEPFCANRSRRRRTSCRRNGHGRPDMELARLDYDLEWLSIQKVNAENANYTWKVKKASVKPPTKEDRQGLRQRLREVLNFVKRPKGLPKRNVMLLPTLLREGASGFGNLSISKLRESFDSRGIEFPGHLDKASIIRKLEEHDDFFAGSRGSEAGDIDAKECYPVPENFQMDLGNAGSQRRALLDLLELEDLWQKQIDEQRAWFKQQESARGEAQLRDAAAALGNKVQEDDVGDDEGAAQNVWGLLGMGDEQNSGEVDLAGAGDAYAEESEEPALQEVGEAEEALEVGDELTTADLGGAEFEFEVEEGSLEALYAEEAEMHDGEIEGGVVEEALEVAEDFYHEGFVEAAVEENEAPADAQVEDDPYGMGNSVDDLADGSYAELDASIEEPAEEAQSALGAVRRLAPPPPGKARPLKKRRKGPGG